MDVCSLAWWWRGRVWVREGINGQLAEEAGTPVRREERTPLIKLKLKTRGRDAREATQNAKCSVSVHTDSERMTSPIHQTSAPFSFLLVHNLTIVTTILPLSSFLSLYSPTGLVYVSVKVILRKRPPRSLSLFLSLTAEESTFSPSN